MQNEARQTDKPVGAIVHELTASVTTLMRTELELAKSEMRDSMAKMTAAGAMFGAAAVLGVFALAVLLTAGVLALSMVLQPWAAAVIVGVVLLIGAGVLAMVGRKKAANASIVPQRTLESVRTDVDVVKRELAAVKERR